MASTMPNLSYNIQALEKSPSIVSTTADVNTSPASASSPAAAAVCSDAASSPGSVSPPASPSAAASVLTSGLRAELQPLGFECHPLLIGWYNAEVAAGFHLPHPPNTLAVLVLSTPDMFEQCFVPHVRRVGPEPTSRRDPLDSCMRLVLAAAARRVHEPARVLHDFELGPTRRPRVLVQTAGHVSGAVRLYRREELREDPWPDRRAVMGVCLHPEFGGWFALRAVIVLDGVETPDLPRPQPREILTTEEQKREAIELFNWHWRDWRYRDVGGARRRYSALQRQYFSAPPGQRQPVIDQILRDEEATKETSAENGKTSAEDGKTSAEDGKTSAEDGKTSAEDGKTSAEDGKTSAEHGKTSAEDGKTSAEDGKMSAEDGRTSVEDGKTSA